MLRPGFAYGLLLPSLIYHDALLRCASIRRWHASLSTMLAAHIKSLAFDIWTSRGGSVLTPDQGFTLLTALRRA
jgi:hypothetical protein